MRKILFVANVDKEHILKFHVPTIKKFVENNWQVDVACAGNEKIPYITNRFYMSWKRNPISLSIFKEIKKLRKIIKNNTYDIIYCHTPTGGFATRVAVRKIKNRNFKVVYFAHGFHFYKKSPVLNWLLFYPVEKHLSKYTDLLITLNNEDYNNAKNWFSKTCKYYLSNSVGINLSDFSSENLQQEREKYRKEFGLENTELCLGYVAEIIKNKNQKMLLKVVKELIKDGYNAKLILVGPDHSKGKFGKLIKRNLLNGTVITTGWRNDANKIISCFDYCVPSSKREGLGLNVVESMEKGIPIIATSNRGHKSIICDGVNGFLVGINNYKSMANKIIILESSNNLKKNIINNAKITSLKYEQSKVVSDLYKEIEKLSEDKL